MFAAADLAYVEVFRPLVPFYCRGGFTSEAPDSSTEPPGGSRPACPVQAAVDRWLQGAPADFAVAAARPGLATLATLGLLGGFWLQPCLTADPGALQCLIATAAGARASLGMPPLAVSGDAVVSLGEDVVAFLVKNRRLGALRPVLRVLTPGLGLAAFTRLIRLSLAGTPTLDGPASLAQSVTSELCGWLQTLRLHPAVLNPVLWRLVWSGGGTAAQRFAVLEVRPETSPLPPTVVADRLLGVAAALNTVGITTPEVENLGATALALFWDVGRGLPMPGHEASAAPAVSDAWWPQRARDTGLHTPQAAMWALWPLLAASPLKDHLVATTLFSFWAFNNREFARCVGHSKRVRGQKLHLLAAAAAVTDVDDPLLLARARVVSPAPPVPTWVRPKDGASAASVVIRVVGEVVDLSNEDMDDIRVLTDDSDSDTDTD
jgi:hypothetical protein